MNKLLFTLKRDFNDDIILVANNAKDLEDYLRTNYDFYSFSIYENYVQIIARPGSEDEFANLQWVKHI